MKLATHVHLLQNTISLELNLHSPIRLHSEVSTTDKDTLLSFTIISHCLHIHRKDHGSANTKSKYLCY